MHVMTFKVFTLKMKEALGQQGLINEFISLCSIKLTYAFPCLCLRVLLALIGIREHLIMK